MYLILSALALLLAGQPGHASPDSDLRILENPQSSPGARYLAWTRIASAPPASWSAEGKDRLVRAGNSQLRVALTGGRDRSLRYAAIVAFSRLGLLPRMEAPAASPPELYFRAAGRHEAKLLAHGGAQ